MSWYLKSRYGLTGLAIAFSVSATVQLLVLWLILRTRRGGRALRDLVRSGAKTLLATLALAAVAYPLRQIVGTLYPLRTFWQVALQAGAALSGGTAAFVAVSWLLRSEEFAEIRQAVTRRLWRRATLSEGANEAQ